MMTSKSSYRSPPNIAERAEMWELQVNRARKKMVKEQLARRGITDVGVLKAMAEVPRHLFVFEEDRKLAYGDRPLPIGEGQTISQPFIVALMTQLLRLRGNETVLEIGTGSGYQAAILGGLARKVVTLERHEELADRARTMLAKLGIHNVTVHQRDGSEGWPEESPYDAILVTAAAPVVPNSLLAQLVDGGRLTLPVGGAEGQQLQLWIRQGDNYSSQNIVPVSFVPLRGTHGWDKEEWDPKRK